MSGTLQIAFFRSASLAFILLMLGLCLSACSLDKNCFDPDDPCPNNMIEDEYGCVWDHCAGEVFWGERIPCLAEDEHDNLAWWTLVGAHAQYLAYVRDATAEDGTRGPLWLYDLETGEQRSITESERRCTWVRASGNWVGCIEIGEYVGAYTRASDLLLVNVVSGVEWQIPNEERMQIASYSISGDRVVFVRRSEFYCASMNLPWDQVWVFDLTTGELSLIADSVEESYRSTNAEIAGDVVAYWRVAGLCSGEYWSQLRMYNTASGVDSMFKEWSYHVYVDNNSLNDFAFDGQWVAMDEGSGIRAYAIDGSREIDVAYCPLACDFNLSNGKVAYTQSGADGLNQLQVHVFDLETETDAQVTFGRPFWDGASVQSLLGNRLLWGEGRGHNVWDDCGNFRPGSSQKLLFWKDIDF
ncbi:MAG: hypothetical protein JRF33_18505 [Deltaproteobacteria bacterium]|nr:hypothetical protein [Deltaproteobacteria bacterium]